MYILCYYTEEFKKKMLKKLSSKLKYAIHTNTSSLKLFSLLIEAC